MSALPVDATMLVIVVARIGDTLLATPALRALKEAFPRGRLQVLAHPQRACLLDNLPFIDDLGDITAKRALWRDRFVEKRYDAAFVYGNDLPLIRYARRVAKRVIGFRQPETRASALLDVAVPPPALPTHAVLERLLLPAAVGATTTNYRLAYAPTAAERQAAHAWLDRVAARKTRIGLQVASFPTKAYRDWPEENFARLMEQLQNPKTTFVILGDTSSAPAAKRLAERFPGSVVNASGRFGLRDSAALIGSLDLYVGVDTGPTHLAGALDVPMVALYHCLHPGRLLAPLQHPALTVIEHPAPAEQCSRERTMAEISVGTVVAATRRYLPGGATR